MKNGKRYWDFYGRRKIFFAISLGFLAIGILFNVLFGLELDISFKGGTLIKYSYQGDLDKDSVASFVDNQLGKSVSVETASNGVGGSNTLNVSLTDTLTTDEQKSLDSAMKSQYADNNITQLSFNTLSPTMGNLFLLKCLVAIGLASILLVIYVAFRFRKIGGWSAGAMALVSLLHDMLVIYFTFVIFRIPLNDNFVAVVLAILGYSLNDTVVIYDRIRENRRLMDAKTPIGTIVNDSINQSFTRSFNTALCTFLSIAVVAVMAMAYGLDSIVSFALPMMLGIVSGCYSSICICGPLWVMWRNHVAKKAEIEKAKTAKAKA